MLFRLRFCLGYVNHVCPTKKCKLWIHYTVNCTLYTCTLQCGAKYTRNKTREWKYLFKKEDDSEFYPSFHIWYIQEFFLGTVLVNTYFFTAQVPVFKWLPGGINSRWGFVCGWGVHLWVGGSFCGLPLPQLVNNSGSGRDIFLNSFGDIRGMFLT